MVISESHQESQSCKVSDNGEDSEYVSCTQEKGYCGESCGFQLTYPQQTSIGVGVATFPAL